MRHNFKERNAYSLDQQDEPFWLAVYKEAFPTMARQELISNRALQKQGMDRSIYFLSGHALHIDEKKREGVYSDFLLEYLSNDQTNSPGWIEKDLTIHYLAYAFMPIRTVYLLDWFMLRRSWHLWGEAWLRRCEHVPSENEGYTTWSVAVPITEVYNAIRIASKIEIQH